MPKISSMYIYDLLANHSFVQRLRIQQIISCKKALPSQEHFVTNDPSLYTLLMKAQSTCKFICWEATERDYAKLFPLENN